MWTRLVQSPDHVYELAIDQSPATRTVRRLGKATQQKTLPQALPKTPVEVWQVERGNLTLTQHLLISKSARFAVGMGREREK